MHNYYQVENTLIQTNYLRPDQWGFMEVESNELRKKMVFNLKKISIKF